MTVDKFMPVTYRLSENNGAVFAATRQVVDRQLQGLKITTVCWRLSKRIDETAVLLPPGSCYNMPPAFHACIGASAALLFQYNSTGLKYEGDRTTRIDVRGILAHWARQYDIEDVNDVVKFYPEARLWLSHKHHTHPATFDGLVNYFKVTQKRILH